jgi:hypothetical protein
MNWRGRPLESHEVVVELIGATTTHTGLRVRAELDRGRYPLGVKVRDQELAAVPLTRHEFHADASGGPIMTVSRATFWTRLREGEVIIGPIRRLSVLKAIALSATHGSVRGRIRDPIPQEQAVPTSGLSNPGELDQETRIRQLVERCQVQSALHGSSPWEPRRRSTTWPAPTRRTIPRRTTRALDPGP